LISIVMPVLNEAAILGATLKALQPFRGRGHELILVDGGSRDGTPELARPLVDRLLSAPRGRARQMNAGAHAARGAVLWFLHADVRPPDDADRRILEALAHGDGWGRFDVRLSGVSRWLRLVGWSMNQRSRLTGIATGDQGIFVSRALFQAVGGYPNLPLMEDIELSRRLRSRQRPHCLRTRILASGRRWEQGGVWRTVLRMWLLRAAHALGLSTERLARYYRDVR